MALTGKTIGQLTYLSGVTTDTLFPVELSGDTYHIAYSAFTNSNYNEGTYDNLYSFATGGTLTAGSYYLMTDFQTCYDQPNYDVNGTPITIGNYKTGTTEPILLLAISTTGFSPTVYSTLYPQDKISYDITWNATEVTDNPAKGRITERIDEFNNRTDYDHRQVVFKRYETSLSSGIYTVIKDNGNPYIDDIPTFGTGCYSNKIGNFYTTLDLNNTGFILSNNIFDDDCWDNTTGADFYNNTIGSLVYENKFGDLCHDNVIQGDAYNNVINNNFSLNTIGGQFYNNTIFNGFRLNVIGSQFEGNEILSGFRENQTSAGFAKNRIGYDFRNVGITIGTNFLDNQIGNNFTDNIAIGDDFQNNVIGNNFQKNNIGNGFFSNQIGILFKDNTCYGSFAYNTIGTNFNYNEVQDGFGFGGPSSQGNRIGNYFENNTIGEYFYNNTISDNFQSNEVGDSFQWNIVNTEVNNVCLSTGMLYDITTVNVFKNKNGDNRLSYYDEVDVLTIETLTEAPCLGGLNALDIPENDLNFGLIL
jgi:hypothetical protein